MSANVKHMTSQINAKPGDLVTVECGRSIIRRDPELIQGLRVCKRCQAKFDKRPKWFTYSVQIWPKPEPIRSTSTERES